MFFMIFVCLSAFCAEKNSTPDPSVLESENWQGVKKEIAVLTQDEISQKIADLAVRKGIAEQKEQEVWKSIAELEDLQKKTEEQRERLQRMQAEQREAEKANA